MSFKCDSGRAFHHNKKSINKTFTNEKICRNKLVEELSLNEY